ncbi:MAG: substrate-binding domain-containing protein [Nannocystaceae bacterium]|nr:substrate-binding domain-containing protein [bacterium]
MDDTPQRHWKPWIAGIAVFVVVVAWAVLEVRGVGEDSRPAFLTTALEPSGPNRPDDARLHIAGSGSCVPLTRMLAGSVMQRLDLSPEVHASIGSGGGIRALRDGAIELAIVSRALRDEEIDAGLVYTPFARVPVIVAAGLDVPDRAVTYDELSALFDGRRTQWSDGTKVVVLLREAGDSSHRVVEEVVPEFADITASVRAQGAFRVLYHDGAMQVALANTPGAVGLHGNGVDPSLAGFRALAVEGVEPTGGNVESGAYPFVKELGFVTIGPPQGEAKAFIDYVLSPQGRALLRVRGAVPPAPEGD